MSKSKWLEEFAAETARAIQEPFFQCLAAAIAAVESGRGSAAIRDGSALNEIGYKAIAGKPAKVIRTKEDVEPGPGETLQAQAAAFRLFRDRFEQGQALAYLLRSSINFEAARLLFVLAFYSGYAPGRSAGLRTLIKVFDELAGSGRFEGVRPFGMTGGRAIDKETRKMNHAAAREAVRMWAELTGAD